MKYLNIGVHQICRNLHRLEIKCFGEKEYIHGYTNNAYTINAIIEYCKEKGIDCGHEEYRGFTYFSVEINERGIPGYEARA